MYEYKPHGVCTQVMQFDIDEETDTIHSVSMYGGCDGNTTGISRLVEGMKVDEAIARLEGITCGPRKTSCPDQFAQALKKYKEVKAGKQA